MPEEMLAPTASLSEQKVEKEMMENHGRFEIHS